MNDVLFYEYFYMVGHRIEMQIALERDKLYNCRIPRDLDRMRNIVGEIQRLIYERERMTEVRAELVALGVMREGSAAYEHWLRLLEHERFR